MSRSGGSTLEPSMRSIAEEFASYARLDGLDRWKFRRLLRWIRRDSASVQLLRDLESKLAEKGLFSWSIFESHQSLLTWYNRELKDDRLENRLQPCRLPEMLQVLIVFLDHSQKLDCQYRGLIVHIIDASDRLGAHGRVCPGMTPEQFRLEAAKLISSLSSPTRTWEDWELLLNSQAESRLACLENIARKVCDLQQFRTVYEEMAPAISLEVTSALMAMSESFQDFSRYFDRVTAQLEHWRWKYSDVFRQVEDRSELDQLLMFLEALAKHPLLERCIRYTQVHGQAAWLFPTSEVKDICLNRKWMRTLDHHLIMVGLVETFVQKIVHHELSTLWSRVGDNKTRWPFDQFTEHVPYDTRHADWTVDSDHTRRYWNWQEGQARQRDQFLAALGPPLCERFRELDIEEFDIVLNLLPQYLHLEEFAQPVRVPVTWTRGIELQETYTKWTGFYDEEIEVARPSDFALHTFTFERANFRKALDLLDDESRLRRAIQTYRHS